MPRAVCAGSFGAAFAKCLWPLVLHHISSDTESNVVQSDVKADPEFVVSSRKVSVEHQTCDMLKPVD